MEEFYKIRELEDSLQDFASNGEVLLDVFLTDKDYKYGYWASDGRIKVFSPTHSYDAVTLSKVWEALHAGEVYAHGALSSDNGNGAALKISTTTVGSSFDAVFEMYGHPLHGSYKFLDLPVISVAGSTPTEQDQLVTKAWAEVNGGGASTIGIDSVLHNGHETNKTIAFTGAYDTKVNRTGVTAGNSHLHTSRGLFILDSIGLSLFTDTNQAETPQNINVHSGNELNMRGNSRIVQELLSSSGHFTTKLPSGSSYIVEYGGQNALVIKDNGQILENSSIAFINSGNDRQIVTKEWVEALPPYTGQDLQAVTTVGNITNKSIVVADNSNGVTIQSGASAIKFDAGGNDATIKFEPVYDYFTIDSRIVGNIYRTPLLGEDFVQRKYVDDEIAAIPPTPTPNLHQVTSINNITTNDIKSGEPNRYTCVTAGVIGGPVGATGINMVDAGTVVGLWYNKWEDVVVVDRQLRGHDVYDQLDDKDYIQKKYFDDHGGGGGAVTFDQLTDTPTNKTGSAGKILAVNAGETALVYIDAPAGVAPTLQEVTTVGNTSTHDIVVGNSTKNTTISDGSGGAPVIMMTHDGHTNLIAFDGSTQVMQINNRLAGLAYIVPTDDKDYVQRKYVTDTVAASVTSGTGPTTSRPATPAGGYMWVDTTLGYPTWYINGAWVNATGALV